MTPAAETALINTQLLVDALAGLKRSPKTLPCKYFYDRRGSELFDQICVLPEYYPTRTETAIMRQNIKEIAAVFGPDALLIEYGSGSSTKTRILLDCLPRLAGYVPVDISHEHLYRTAESLRAAYPRLTVLPLAADYTQNFIVPDVKQRVAARIVYFPGSTIGNFHRGEAAAFLARIAGVCGPGGGLLIGVDLRKPAQEIEPAYNDASGVTAAFNLNLLARMNAEIGASFQTGGFAHSAFYDEEIGRIEMHLVSLKAQTVWIGGETIRFAEGETIWTECSYKYSLSEFSEMARSSGFCVRRVWTDADEKFSVQYLTAG